MVLGTSEVW